MGKKIYTYYLAIIFVIIYVVSFPIQLIIIQFNRLHYLGHKLNKFIIKLFLFFAGISVEIIGVKHLNKDVKYIFCPNHSSYIDILSCYYLSDSYFKFLGKDSLEKIPLFGYMYKKLYITVNRRDKDSRKNSLLKCESTLDEGIGLTIYPEGAIHSKAPELIHFKDGAFRLSIDKNTPIVPVTMPFNHEILPASTNIFGSRRIKIIIHEPLNTIESPVSDYKVLRDKTYEIIHNELKNHKVI